MGLLIGLHKITFVIATYSLLLMLSGALIYFDIKEIIYNKKDI